MKKYNLVIFIMFVSLLNVLGQENLKDDKPFIEVKQIEDTLVTPNEFYISYQLLENNLKQYKSLDEVEMIIFNRFKELGLNPTENVKLSYADTYVRKDIFKGKSNLDERNFEIKVTEYLKISSVFKTLDSIGLIRIKIDRLNYDKSKDISEVLYSKACKNAKRKAKIMAESVDKNLGNILIIQTLLNSSEKDYDVSPFRGNFYRGYGDQMGVIGGLNDHDNRNLEFQKIKLSVSILFRVELK